MAPKTSPEPLMRSILAALPLMATLAFVLPAQAETPLTGAEFEAETRGLTVTFAADGQIFGTETYLGGGQTIWQFAGGPCVSGAWKERGEDLCFTYAGDPVPACWRFSKVNGKLHGTLNDTAGPFTITETARSNAPLTCSPAPAKE
jgi:hypothetical protein